MQRKVSKFLANRIFIFRLALILAFVGLAARFFQVQIIQQEHYARASRENRVRQKILSAPRGLILDRYGEILVDNLPAYSIYAVPSQLKGRDSVFTLLSEILQTPERELRRRFRRDRRGPFQRVKLARYVEFPTLAYLEERKVDLPGVEFDVEPRRFYPAGITAPHVFGYLGEITEEELKTLRSRGYEKGDIIGKKGLEKVYDEQLRGEKGFRYVEVDALGREVGTLKELGEKPPVPGKNLVLALDAQLQRFLETVMMDKRGAAVVLNCKNGEVIAMVSKPDFDPEIFAKPISKATWDTLTNNPGHPLYDRAVQSLYPPGSTYKLVLAMAGLESGRIDPREKIFCPGYLRLGIRKFDCWKKGGHGNVNLLEAIEQSCNVYFYRTIQKVGLAPWVEFSHRFHFGEKTGIDLVGEKPGLVPDSSYFDRRYGKKRWTSGQILNLSVGQGDLLVTPLQMAFFAMIIANRGIGFRPHLARLIEDPITGEEQWIEPDTVRVFGISESTWNLIHEGIFRVVNGEHGTARAANPGRITVAGKTGTAQNPHGDPHAWFIGFAPFEDPQIAVAILVENGGSGGAKAAPIARGIFRLLLRNQKIRIPGTQKAQAD